MSRSAGDRPVTLATPFRSTVPSLGTTCGPRERGVGASDRQEQSCRSTASVTVEDTLVFGKAIPFAGRRWNEGLDRSVAWAGVPPLPAGAPATAGVLWCQGGERRRHAHPSTCTRREGSNASRAQGTRPSLGPKTRARQSPLNFVGASRRRWRVRVDIAVGQTRASGRNRHRGRNEWTERGSPRVTASARRLRDASEPEGGRGLRPSEDRELGFVPARRKRSCRSRSATSGLE